MVDTRPMARFVLVHGGWHGGWCFRWLAEELEDRGHDVATPDLPCEEIGLTPLDYARAVGPQPDAIVVGHSLGGFTIPHIVARARVYLAALPPLERGQIDECFVEGFGGAVRDTRDRSYWPDADTAAARMYPDCSRRSPTGPSRSSAARRGLTRFPHRSGAATSSLRPCRMPRSILTGRFARPAPTARV
jgi:pimeloyl-ACP methyl ester carboxylesterase